MGQSISVCSKQIDFEFNPRCFYDRNGLEEDFSNSVDFNPSSIEDLQISSNSKIPEQFNFPSLHLHMAYKNEISWKKCIQRESEFEANILTGRRILPSNNELNEACRVFGRLSRILLDISLMICEHIKTRSSNVIDIWPSYRTNNDRSNISIGFVVFIKKNSQFSVIKDYAYHIIYEKEFSNEGQLVASKESTNDSVLNNPDDNLEQLRKCINKNADDLLQKHSNLNIILPSLWKSVGYMSVEHDIKVEPCVAFYVTVKGWIPLREEPFDKDEIDGFPIDVLEGDFEPFKGGPNEYHEHLKIGLAIHADIRNEDGILGGTLGGFVEHSKHGLCEITCAHVLYSSHELSNIKEKKPFKMDKTVYQPIGESSSAFGKVANVVYSEGDHSSPGLEIALFNIFDRKPKDGSFPRVFNDTEAGFDENNPLRFNSGEVCETSKLKRRTEVYKFGMSSGITRGSFALQGAVLRKGQMQGHLQGFGFNLKNQIVVLQIGENPFAEPGDSGALVLIEGEQDSVAIGIVEGGMKGRVFVTPICDILRAAGCTELKMCQFIPEEVQNVIESSVDMEIN